MTNTSTTPESNRPEAGTARAASSGQGEGTAPMLLTQVIAYVALIVAGALPLAAGWTDGASVGFGGQVPCVIVVAVVLAAFMAYWPLRASLADRIAAVVFGVASLLFAITPLVWTMGLMERDPKFAQCDAWALGAGGLLVLLVVFAFGRQMAREERSHLIRGLSHAVTAGTAAISAAGWAFLPVLLAVVPTRGMIGIAALIVIVLFAAALAYASVFWHREMDPDPATKRPWMGVGLLPVMLMGATVAIAALLLMRL